MAKLFSKTLVSICAAALIITAMGSSSVVAHAEETTEILSLVAEPELPVYEALRGDSEDCKEVDLAPAEVEETDTAVSLRAGGKASLGLDVCFFIRNGVDSDIPNEPQGHPMSDYSQPIRIDDATYSNHFVYDPNYIEGPYAFDDDGFTIFNNVLDNLLYYPTSEEIKTVVPEFDPKTQFVVWYVLKTALTDSPNGDVFIHVDGVIKTRQETYSEENSDDDSDDDSNDVYDDSKIVAPGAGTEPSEPTEPQKPVIDVSGLKFNVYSKELERVILDDGEYVGGYVIEVLNLEGTVLAEYQFGIYGQEIDKRVFLGANSTSDSSADVDFSFDDLGIQKGRGTIFTFLGQTFKVNVDSAYIKVKNNEFQVIPLLFNGEEVKPDKISISDSNGQFLAGGTNVPRVVNKQKITVTAGSTVQNDNGQTLTNTDTTVSSGSLMKGHEIVATFNGSLTGPGECVNEITDIHIVDSNGRDATAYYDITLEKGKLVLVKNEADKKAEENSTGSAVTRVIARDGAETVVSNSQHVFGTSRDDSDSVKTGVAVTGKTKLSSNTGETKSGKLSADSDSENAEGGQVLGARRADTGDNGMNSGARLALIVLCVMLISVVNIKRNKTK
ncbi:hypothetical protein [Butyrivibrio sp. VCB2006]|uniref:hypothetical protein n=1 Tax=Butyrivibrio sp. VCB2006 TaxID=1280679 RepID=UPI00049230D8|nr:hypothetical protein [Butyrivibrio sp. VCB2006]